MKKRKRKRKKNEDHHVDQNEILLSLFDIISQYKDPRNEKGKRHPFVSMLALLIIGLMCGMEGYTPIATWARFQPELTKLLGFTHENTPAASTFHNLLKRLDPDVLQQIFTKWTIEIEKRHPDFSGCFDAVAIDGKILRASLKSGAETPYLLSVVCHKSGVTLTQRGVVDKKGVVDKTNEIPVSRDILDDFDVTGKIITTDALLTQRAFCSKVVEHGGDYLQLAKKNQRGLLEAIATLYQDIPDTTSGDIIHPILKEPIFVHTTVDKAHGRLETRCIRTSASLNDYLDWPGVAQVFQLRTTRKIMKTGEEKHTVQYGITSLSPEEASAERLLTIKRGHWSIENKSHWMRDNLLGEDASPVRCGAIPQVMATLRNVALSVLRFKEAMFKGLPRTKDRMNYLMSKPKVAYNMIL